MVEQISGEELASRLGEDPSLLVVDVREADEFADWSIPGALNIPLTALPAEIASLPDDKELVVVCAAGRRAEAAAGELEAAGRPARVLAGGMDAWADTYDAAEATIRGATVVQVRRRGKGCLSYLVGAGGEAAVVDPSTETDRYVDLATAHGWRITRVLETHLHADHVSGARALAALTGAAFELARAEPFSFDHELLPDPAVVKVGPVEIACLPTPGHTPGSTSYLVGDGALLSGDILFVDGVGRPDLADRSEEFARALYATVHDRVLTLDPDLLVLPAHVGTTVEIRPGELVGARLGTLAEQLEVLSYDEERFVAWAVGSVGERPPNYEQIVRANAAGLAIPADERHRLEAGPNRCAVAPH